MSITLAQDVAVLLTGDKLSWGEGSGRKPGAIRLDTPGARRLFEHLVDADRADVIEPGETLFSGLIGAWSNDDHDPADTHQTAEKTASGGPWRLSRIETFGFGGLNTYDGPEFDLPIEGQNWSLEGYNGSGKTSLVSAILWALTGYRARKQDAPIRETGLRAPILNDAGKQVGTWPPIVNYPTAQADLSADAVTWVRLTFADPTGEEAVAYRKLTAPRDSEPTLEVHVDARLVVSPELIEVGLLMPARIAHIGFGEKSASLYDALKILTGLDQLADIAGCASTLTRSNGRFLKFAKDQGADRQELAFTNAISRAREHAENGPVHLPEDFDLKSETLSESLEKLIDDASTRAAKSLNILKTDLAATMSLEDAEDRKALQSAVSAARVVLDQRGRDIEIFQHWKALTDAETEDSFAALPGVLQDLENALAAALDWHAKQTSDNKLRLKALAASFFIPATDLETAAKCPLCETNLTSDSQKALAGELESLKSEAAAAERKIDDACSDLRGRLDEALPQALTSRVDTLATMDPVASYEAAMLGRFADNPSYKDVLTGYVSSTRSLLAKQCEALPRLADAGKEDFPPEEPQATTDLRLTIAKVRRCIQLVNWWTEQRVAYASAWEALIGKTNEQGEWPDESLQGMVQRLETALADAEPLDKLATQLTAAKTAAESWAIVNAQQEKRENIAAALQPLKDLRALVDCETSATLTQLSGRIAALVDDIRIKDRFEFRSTALARKSVTVEGGFCEGLKIDAALVASTSWLRGILWAFIFALRDHTIEDLGCNPFPLVLLDDPQMTFDQTNERMWARTIASIANRDADDVSGMQLLMVTHSRRFFTMLSDTEGLTGERAKLAGPTHRKPVVSVLNGSIIQRDFEKAAENEDPDDCVAYVRSVRVYCENLFRIMLRKEAYEISGNSLGKFRERLATLRSDHVAPYTQSPFGNLLKQLDRNNAVIKILEQPHHEDDGTIDFATAQRVRAYWNNKLAAAFSNAFQLAVDHDAYGGDPRVYSWTETTASFPPSQAERLKTISFLHTGVVVAAATDGRIGDGLITLLDLQGDDAKTILHNHDAYRVTARTLTPVADVGDVVLVRNFGPPTARNLVVAPHGDTLLARRLNDADAHPDIYILTGQATDPYALPEAVIALKSQLEPRKIVGTVFLGDVNSPPAGSTNEVEPLEDLSLLEAHLKDAHLLRVQGHSMEPVALDGQFVIIRRETCDVGTILKLDGRLVIAIDDSGGTYFKRFRPKRDIAILESVSSDGATSSEVLSLRPDGNYPVLTELFAVLGVLFEI